MCSLLNEPIKKGKAKQLQLKNWKRYFRFHLDGHEFIVTAIYNKPKEEIDKRHDNGGNSTSAISEYMQNAIYTKLNCDGIIEGNCNRLLREFGLLSYRFFKIYYNINSELKSYDELSKAFTYDFCAYVYRSYKARMMRILREIEGRESTKTERYWCVVYGHGDKNRITNAETIAKIVNAKNDCIWDCGFAKYDCDFNRDKSWMIFESKETARKFYSDFIKRVRKILKNENIDACYPCFRIISCDTFPTTTNQQKEKLRIAKKRFAENAIKKVSERKAGIFDFVSGELKDKCKALILDCRQI